MFKELDYFDFKLIKSRKKWRVLVGTDLKSNYHIIFVIDAKTKFLRKDIIALQELEAKISRYLNHNFKYSAIYITSALCSKAKDELKMLKYRVWIK
jgi:hypothetical protein